MDNKIVKVIYTDGEEKELKDWKTPQELKSEFGYSIDWEANRHYKRQFLKFEEDVLLSLDDDSVRSYAKYNLDLKDEGENDCDCKDKDVSDFEDEELTAELIRRNMLGYVNVNIISIDLFTRFSRIITVADNQELEAIISELEKKYNI